MKQIEIHNFKKIKNLNIDGFKRINLIGGCNNSGKSSILEVIYLLQNINSRYILAILTNSMVSRTYDGVSNIARMQGFFNDFDFSNKLSISSPEFGAIKMSSDEWGIVGNLPNLVTQKSDIEQTESQKISRKIKVDIIFSNRLSISAEIVENNIKQLNEIDFATINPNVCILIDENNSIKTEQNNFSIFNELSKIISNNLEDELINNALKLFDENITSIAIIPTNYGQHQVMIGHKNFASKIPLHSYGVGLKRVLNIVMSIINSKDGVVLIDEIENGIHYSIMPKLWEAIIKLTKKYNCQLFATTHSQEYAEYILNNNNTWISCKDDFNFITLNLYNKEIVISMRSGEEFEYAIKENNSEVRGQNHE